MLDFVRLFRVAVVLSIGIGLVFGPIPYSVSAQQIESHTSDANGRTVTWSDDWELNASASEDSLQMDRIMIQGVDQVVMMNVVFMADTFDRTEVRDALLDNLKTGGSAYNLIDSGDYNNLSYELSVFELDGVEVGSFILVFTNNGTTALHIIAPIDRFSDGVELAQSTVTLDGVETFEGIDGVSLQAQLEQAAGSSVTNAGSSQQTRTSSSTSTSAGSGGTGTTFTSSAWGYNVNYPSGWNSDSSLNIGELDLASSGLNAIVSFQGLENPGLDGTTLELALMSTFADSVGGSGNVITSASNTGGAVFVGTADGMIMIQELVIVSPSVVVMVTAVIIGDYDSSLSQLQGITINGKRILSLL